MAHAIQMDRRLGKFKAASMRRARSAALARTRNFDGIDEVRRRRAYGERRSGSTTTSVPASASVL
jgi:hypothetical protein